MTNPLSKQEQAACDQARRAGPISNDIRDEFRRGFAAALAYLRAEQAKEEPSAWVCTHPTGFNGKPYIGRPYRTKEEADTQEGGFTVKPLYLRPSEPSKVLYDELLYAVARKFPGETRHQTALRYINAAESQTNIAGPSTSKEKDQ